MRQLVYVRTGVLEWQEAAEPRLEGAGEALVRPLSVARCDLDAAIFFGRAPIPGPFPVGHEFTAEVVELGKGVTGFKAGERVVVSFQICCGKCRNCLRGATGSCESAPPRAMYGLGNARGSWGGAISDLVRVPFAENMMVALPEGMDPVGLASLSDNMVDGWRTVGPYLREMPGASVLVVGGGAWSVGLYAAAIAKAMGAGQVDYVDTDRRRLELAEKVGARAIEGPPPERMGQYQITVDASADEQVLGCALRSTEPEGVCTSVGIYFGATTPVPLNEMFYNGITFKTGRANSRAGIPAVLDLIRKGAFKPEMLTTKLAPWDEAAEALLDTSSKVVVFRH